MEGGGGEPATCETLVTLSQQHQSHLNPRKSFFTTERWVQICFNQKEINYISGLQY